MNISGESGATKATNLDQDYGAFIDIGLGRVDALMPNSMMGDKVLAAPQSCEQ